MDGRDPLVVHPQRHGLRRLQEAPRPLGEFLKVHIGPCLPTYGHMAWPLSNTRGRLPPRGEAVGRGTSEAGGGVTWLDLRSFKRIFPGPGHPSTAFGGPPHAAHGEASVPRRLLPPRRQHLAEEAVGIPARRLRRVGDLAGDLVVDPGELGAGLPVDRQVELVADLVIMGGEEVGELLAARRWRSRSSGRPTARPPGRSGNGRSG